MKETLTKCGHLLTYSNFLCGCPSKCLVFSITLELRQFTSLSELESAEYFEVPIFLKFFELFFYQISIEEAGNWHFNLTLATQPQRCLSLGHTTGSYILRCCSSLAALSSGRNHTLKIYQQLLRCCPASSAPTHVLVARALSSS